MHVDVAGSSLGRFHFDGDGVFGRATSHHPWGIAAIAWVRVTADVF
jgi:hypothetical protein